MARIIGWRPIPQEKPKRFTILNKYPNSQSLEVHDRNTGFAYMVQAAGVREYETLVNADDAEWARVSKIIEE